MPLTVAFAIALAEARSCLAALADTATSFDESIHFEHLLLELDAMHEANLPALYPLTSQRAALMRRLEIAVDRMFSLGGLPASMLLDPHADQPSQKQDLTDVQAASSPPMPNRSPAKTNVRTRSLACCRCLDHRLHELGRFLVGERPVADEGAPRFE